MKRFDTVCVTGVMSVVDYDLPVVSYDETLTDKSHFIPTSEAIKRLSASGALSDAEVSQNYDFTDGHDTGMKVPVGRMRGLDIAEVSNAVKAEQQAVRDEVKRAKDKADYKKLVSDLSKKASDSSDVSTVGSQSVPVGSNTNGSVN